MPSLRVDVPGSGPTVYHLYKKITSLGSSGECDVVLPDPLVPDSFAHIHFDGQVYTIATASRRHNTSSGMGWPALKAASSIAVRRALRTAITCGERST